MHHINHKGNVAEAAIAAAAIKLGVGVIKPLVEHTRYDLIFDLRPRLLRVQCKWAPLKDEVIPVRLVSSRYTSGGKPIRTPYRADQVDAIAVHCEELDRCYLLPATCSMACGAFTFASQRPGMASGRRYTGRATTSCAGL